MNESSLSHNSYLKVAVIVQSYYRKDGTSKKILQDMFKMLEAQTYKKFKVFITGDNYQPNKEFKEVCNEYTGEICINNNKNSFRDLKLGPIENYWKCGGLPAAYHSYITAKNEGYYIALMLDDDDYWYNSHINNVVRNFSKYPETGFMITKAKYFLPEGTSIHLPFHTTVKDIFYNNYIPRGGDSVRAASAHNINIVGSDVLKLWENTIEDVKKIHESNEKLVINAGIDSELLDIIGKNVIEGKYKGLYIPVTSVRKESDANWNNFSI